MKNFIEGIKVAIPNENNKEIVGAVLSVAYDDGTISERAFLNEMDTADQVHLISKLMESASFSIISCLSCVPTGIKKLEQVIIK